MRRLIAAALLCAAAPASALEITLRETLDFGRPASLAFDTLTCTLWVANESRTVTQLALDGLVVGSFEAPAGIRALSTEPAGLVLVTTFGEFSRVDRLGRPRGDAPNLATPTPDVESVEVARDGTLWVLGDDPSYIAHYAANGAELARFDGLQMDPVLSEPQGLAIDPLSSHLLITDDWEGENALFEFTDQGEFVTKISLLPYGTDPEGIAVHAQTRTLWIAFDQGRRISVFDYVPTGGTPQDKGPDCAIS